MSSDKLQETAETATDVEAGDTTAMKMPPNREDLTELRNASMYDKLGRKMSTLDSHVDPFAEREGKTLVWKNVNMTLAATKKDPERKLLDNVWGEVPRRDTTAIMGRAPENRLC